MNGDAPDHDDRTWFRLRDEMTGQDKGYMTPDGEVRDTDPETASKVREAFAKDLMVQDGEVVAELGGVCFGDVCTVGPADAGHTAMVLRNLGALTGLRPERAGDEGDEGGSTGTK